MAKWIPPIPAGALYSKAARAIGPALPLLAYCYDLVQRDGWLEISLKDASADLEEPYQNIKRWWLLLKTGPFFADIEDHGRKGWRVRFKNVWIDWRVLNARVSSDPFPSTNESPELVLETTEEVQTDAQVHFKYISSTNESPELVLENNVYGTHDSDQAKEVGGAKNSRTPSPKKPPTPVPIREALAEVCGIGRISTREQKLQLNQSAAQIWKEQERAGLDIERTVHDILHTASYFEQKDWRGKKGERPTPAQIREVWVAANTNGSNNGKHLRSSAGQHSERKPQVETDLDKPF